MAAGGFTADKHTPHRRQRRICGECEELDALFHCLNEEMFYCKGCCLRIHSKRARMGHTIRDMSIGGCEHIELPIASYSMPSRGDSSGGHGHPHKHSLKDGDSEAIIIDSSLSVPYRNQSFIVVAKQRFSWLLFFLFSLCLTATVMNKFEETLEQELELAYFVPLLIGHGGNSGGQTVSTVIRALGSGDVSKSHTVKIVMKETLAGLVVGLVLAAALLPVIVLVMGTSVDVVVVVLFTLPTLGCFSNFLGAAVPFALASCGYDPAVIAAPFMTTVVDTLGLIIYFTVARVVFAMMGVHSTGGVEGVHSPKDHGQYGPFGLEWSTVDDEPFSS